MLRVRRDLLDRSAFNGPAPHDPDPAYFADFPPFEALESSLCVSSIANMLIFSLKIS